MKHFSALPNLTQLYPAMPGRPFLVKGKFRTSLSEPWSTNVDLDTMSWKMSQVPLSLTNTSFSQEIGYHWLEQAEGEHASVASFSRHTLQLMSIGAPSKLLFASQNSALDEIRHAKICYGIVGALLGSDYGPGPLDVEEGVEKTSLKSIVHSTIEEGCIEETISAVEAHVGAYRSQDLVVKESLSEIATDETKHAQFAWNTIQWIVGKFPEIRDFVEETFNVELESRLFEVENNSLGKKPTACVNSNVTDGLRRYGRVVDADKNKIRQTAIQHIIKPAYRAGLEDVSIISKKMQNLKLNCV